MPLPVALGIWAWFSWPGMPGILPCLGAGVLLVLPPAAHRFGHYRLFLAALALAAAAAGFLAAELRARSLAAPVLTGRYYGPVEGRVIHIDRSAADRMRITLDQLRPTGRANWPEKLRLTLLPQYDSQPPEPGMRVMTMAWLSPPEGPAEPGGFNFARHAWFEGLGAVGSARSPVLMVAPSAEAGSAAVARLRMRLSAAIQARIPGEPGAFAAAMLTGDRSGMGAGAVADLRDSNLYHLVSISGVHMSLLAGFVYQALRFLIALSPALAMRFAAHKLAAAAALPVSVFYLVLSGGDVATLRAFIMVTVMLGAILADRRALSLHSVGLAALLILMLQPEGLTEPGFQMSFAATTALIAGLEALRRRGLPPRLAPLLLVVAGSGLAGLASAPYAAAHFHRATPLGLLPNLLVSPLMGFLVMPGGALMAVLAPFGLEAPARMMLEAGTWATLQIAAFAAGFDGMVQPVARPQRFGLPLLSLGGMMLVLSAGRVKWLGFAFLLLGLSAFALPDRPALLVSADGRLLGLMTPEGRALSHARGAGFAARSWLAADADRAAPARAAARAGFTGPPDDRRFHLGELRGRYLRRLPEGELCEGVDLVILTLPAPENPGACRIFDALYLAKAGALALSPDGAGGAQVRRARDAPPKSWTPAPLRFP
ncbi:ComEC/Rec2 family competence protein [Falsigemmobacter faecalis]|uniref:ComEC family competence protein n=1 Tax=Falsigemmobacter faecalis TaxID=2488730 RepID=A0A3P3DRK2_9RHOB|nr:ComEC/Rec2 family competence protein [Falsigemmobacter faecalis]RRH76316.1 ComEC family competence protein [Falsigemmobacter faecalis]